MDRMELYRDIAQRTQGDIYIGVVGPVRTGKSTFIKRFLDLLVLPGIENEHIRTRVVDELPQSGAGKTIMTTQPKFIPNEAVKLMIDENVHCNVRMVDCVGYWVPGAIGNMENDAPRMVRTPWFDYDIPFEEAAETGTRKVITDHSTIGIAMTTDGSITEIPRESYLEAEERVVEELRGAGKPFVLVINSVEPDGEHAQALRRSLEEKYRVGVMCLDVMHMTAREACMLLEHVLMEFPLSLVQIKVPNYITALDAEHWLMQRILEPLYGMLPKLGKMRDYQTLVEGLKELEDFSPAVVGTVELGSGAAVIELQPSPDLFYTILSEQCGYEIHDDYQLVSALRDFVQAKKEFDRISGALSAARSLGYGLVPPVMDEMELDTPEIVQQGSRFGVRLKARASGLHLIRVDMESEINPIVGTEQQSEELVRYLMDTFEQDPGAIWQTNLFGKSLYDMVRDGMSGKINRMPEQVQQKLRNTLQRIVNEGCNGLICIMF